MNRQDRAAQQLATAILYLAWADYWIRRPDAVSRIVGAIHDRVLSATHRGAHAGEANASPPPPDVEPIHSVGKTTSGGGTCGVRDGDYGVCNLDAGHPGTWHCETREGKLWASWQSYPSDAL